MCPGCVSSADLCSAAASFIAQAVCSERGVSCSLFHFRISNIAILEYLLRTDCCLEKYHLWAEVLSLTLSITELQNPLEMDFVIRLICRSQGFIFKVACLESFESCLSSFFWWSLPFLYTPKWNLLFIWIVNFCQLRMYTDGGLVVVNYRFLICAWNWMFVWPKELLRLH